MGARTSTRRRPCHKPRQGTRSVVRGAVTFCGTNGLGLAGASECSPGRDAVVPANRARPGVGLSEGGDMTGVQAARNHGDRATDEPTTRPGVPRGKAGTRGAAESVGLLVQARVSAIRVPRLSPALCRVGKLVVYGNSGVDCVDGGHAVTPGSQGLAVERARLQLRGRALTAVNRPAT